MGRERFPAVPPNLDWSIFLTKNPAGETTGNEASLTYSGTPVDSGYTYSPDNGGTPAQATLQCFALYFALQLREPFNTDIYAGFSSFPALCNIVSVSTFSLRSFSLW